MDEIAENWKTIVDTLRDGLLVVDNKGDIQAINRSTEYLTGYKADELVGKSCRILNCTGCKESEFGVDGKWCKLFRIGQSRNKKCLITNKEGRIVQVLKSATVLKGNDGKAMGAVETLTDISEIERQHQEIMNLRRAFQVDQGFHGILGKSPVMQRMFELIDSVAQTDAPVMIQGQSGTGKELVARAIHDAGPRRDKPFIKVNCAALNENLLESELFGHVKGAFTGADQNRIGRFEAAHEGTIFLDEIGDIPLSIQVKLLRVLEEKEIERVGSHTPISVNVRIITATNRSLEDLITEGKFRKDFYFRINVFPLCCPPLLERWEDIPLIIQHFISTTNKINTEKKIQGITPGAMEKILLYPWPGNIRELRNVIDYAFVLCPGGEIDIQHLPPKILASEGNMLKTIVGNPKKVTERERLLAALRRTAGNQSEAAKILGVSRVTVWKKIKRLGINLDYEITSF